MGLYRSRNNNVIAGVCGGIAEWLDWTPTAVRIALRGPFDLSVGFPGTLAYFILWIVMPEQPSYQA